jgi:hypothetical protein
MRGAWARWAWVLVLAVGVALYLLVLGTTVETKNPAHNENPLRWRPCSPAHSMVAGRVPPNFHRSPSSALNSRQDVSAKRHRSLAPVEHGTRS